MASPILLGKPFHKIRSFILVSSACRLFGSQNIDSPVYKGKNPKCFVGPLGITVIMSV